jgi:hypothetical protein
MTERSAARIGPRIGMSFRMTLTSMWWVLGPPRVGGGLTGRCVFRPWRLDRWAATAA